MLIKHVDSLKRSTLYHITFDIIGEVEELDCKTDIMLFRIIQESINNIIKHSRGNCIDISLTYTETHLECVVKDDGIGFDVAEKLNTGVKNGSSGLQNIIRRAKMINANYQINSIDNKGTTVCITIPF
jgi:signal transduction histidine kinase